MNKQLMDNYLKSYEGILTEIKDEVKKLYAKQEEINKREQNILEIKSSITQILNFLKIKQEPTIIEKNIQLLDKALEIEHKSGVRSMIELKDLRIVTGDYDGYIRLFTIDYAKKQWTQLKEHKGHNHRITSFCEMSGNKLISTSFDKTLKVWNINNNTITLIKTLEKCK